MQQQQKDPIDKGKYGKIAATSLLGAYIGMNPGLAQAAGPTLTHVISYFASILGVVGLIYLGYWIHEKVQKLRNKEQA